MLGAPPDVKLVFLHANGQRLVFVAAHPVDGLCEVTVTHPDGTTDVQRITKAEAITAANTLRERLISLDWALEAEEA